MQPPPASGRRGALCTQLKQLGTGGRQDSAIDNIQRCTSFSESEQKAYASHFNDVTFIKGLAMLSTFRRLMKNEVAATAIEYTLIAALISVAAIVAMGNVGTKVNGVMSNVASAMK